MTVGNPNMYRSTKGALLLLIITVFWSALPLSACLLTGPATSRHACCTGMAQDCPMQGADMNAPCCRTHSEDAAMIPEVPSAPEHLRIAVLAPHPFVGAIVAFSADAIQSSSETSPPGGSSGANSILRI